MKKYLVLFILILALPSCKKQEFRPEGPTDVRIRNQSAFPFIDLAVKIKDEELAFGQVEADTVSPYMRFKTAFPKAYISAKVNGETITTGPVDFTYMNYFGLVKLTYEVIIENNLLKIKNVVLDSELKIR
jgi:hypothetical protein